MIAFRALQNEKQVPRELQEITVEDKFCVKCVDHCVSCIDGDTCTQCEDGYIQSFDYKRCFIPQLLTPQLSRISRTDDLKNPKRVGFLLSWGVDPATSSIGVGDKYTMKTRAGENFSVPVPPPPVVIPPIVEDGPPPGDVNVAFQTNNRRRLSTGEDLFQITYTPTGNTASNQESIPVEQYDVYGSQFGVEIYWTTEVPVPEFDLTVEVTDLENVFVTGTSAG